MTPERLTRVALMAISRDPKLSACSPESLLNSFMIASQLGLEIGGPLGHAYLVPRWNKNTGRYEATFQLGYRGMIDLSMRSGFVTRCEARAVYDGDHFRIRFGLQPILEHEPGPGPKTPDAIRCFYAVIGLSSGEVIFDMMTRDEVDAIRARSQSGNSGPWVTDYAEMGKKTVFRRLQKYAPSSVDLRAALEADDAGADFDALPEGSLRALPNQITKALPEPDASEFLDLTPSDAGEPEPVERSSEPAPAPQAKAAAAPPPSDNPAAKAVAHFASLGVPAERVLANMGRATVQELTAADCERLREKAKAIQLGELSVDEAMPEGSDLFGADRPEPLLPPARKGARKTDAEGPSA